MRDLPRLMNEGADDFERALLGSHETEVGSDRALARTLAAVGLSGAVATSSASVSAAMAKTSTASLEVASSTLGSTVGSTLGSAAFAKWAVVGALGLAGAGGAWLATRPAAEPASVTELKVVANDARAVELEPSPAATPATDVIPIEELATAEEETNDQARTGAAGQKKRAPAQSLTDEIQAVSEIRDKLSEPAAALEAISRYQARFPRGRLGQEVAVLKIIALESSGQHAQAKALGERFLSAHPESAHAKRIRSVLGMKP